MRRPPAHLILATLTAATLARGAGFSIYEWSPGVNATAGAMLANPFDASTAFVNPAAMTELPGTRLLLSGCAIMPGSTAEFGGQSTALKKQVFLIPGLYASHQVKGLNDKLWLGFASTAEYGLGTKYPEGWAGRWSNLETSLTTFTLAPSAAYVLGDNLSLGGIPLGSISLGASLRVMYIDFSTRRDAAVPMPFPPYLTHMPLSMKGDGWGVGGSASLLWKVAPTVSLGLVYRTEVKQVLKGDSEAGMPEYFTTAAGSQNPYKPAFAAAAAGYTGDAEGILHLPASTTAGVNWQATERLNLGFAATLTEWSSYDALNIKINGVEHPDQKSWRNVWRLGLGARYQLTDALHLMAGYTCDRDPINRDYADFMLPVGSRHILGAGVSYAIKDNWELSLGYSYLSVEKVNANVASPAGLLPTTYKNADAHIVATSVGYKF